MLYQYKPSPPPNIFRNPYPYSPSEILNNPVLRIAAGDVGQAWGIKYGQEWGWVNGYPSNWCDDFLT